jgi:hypothetical protein
VRALIVENIVVDVRVGVGGGISPCCLIDLTLDHWRIDLAPPPHPLVVVQ